MKKKYSLDYSIERDVDRLAAVNHILDTLDNTPNYTELEQMASYILYGKDENGLNAVQRKETTDSDKRYKTFARDADTKNQSLDAILDNPLGDQLSLKPIEEKYVYLKRKPSIRKPKYDKKTGELLDIGDGDIPGMQELWDCIKRLEHVLAVGEGKVPPDDETELITDSYKLYKLRHQIADMRLHQYYLKDAYKPTIHFVAIQHPQPQTYDWDSDAAYWVSREAWQSKVDNALLHTISHNLSDYETRINPYTGEFEVKWVVRHHTFDWENPAHIRALMDNYSRLAMQMYDNVYSWGRTLLRDFDRYQDLIGLSPVRQFILDRKIDKASYATIAAELTEKFGIHYNENHISNILVREIPEKIAAKAKHDRLLLETPQEERKQCFRCKRWLPRDTIFFGHNKGRRDGWASNCKECEKKRRIAKGVQGAYDRRSKDPAVLEVQAGKTGI